jgi:excisionase family DNA binding protein
VLGNPPSGREEPCSRVGFTPSHPTEALIELHRGRNQRLLTSNQAADMLAVSVRTIKNLMGQGKLAYVKIARATRIDPDDIDEFIRRNRRKQRRCLRQVS